MMAIVGLFPSKYILRFKINMSPGVAIYGKSFYWLLYPSIIQLSHVIAHTEWQKPSSRLFFIAQGGTKKLFPLNYKNVQKLWPSMLQIAEGIQNQKHHPDTWTFWSSWRKLLSWTFLKILDTSGHPIIDQKVPCNTVMVSNIPHMRITIRNLSIASGPGYVFFHVGVIFILMAKGFCQVKKIQKSQKN